MAALLLTAVALAMIAFGGIVVVDSVRSLRSPVLRYPPVDCITLVGGAAWALLGCWIAWVLV